VKKEILSKEIDTDLMLYDVEKDEVHVLNAVAGLVYKMHREGKAVGHMEGAVRRAFRVPDAADVPGDIAMCTQELKTKGLIE